MKGGKGTVCHFAEKTRFFHSLRAGRCCFFLFVSVRPFSSRWFFRCFCPARAAPYFRRHCSAARARRRSRTPEGRTERRSRRGHRPPRRGGKVRADAPCAARRAGDCLSKRTPSAFPDCGVYGGCGGCRGVSPLSPPAPRRAGDPPPAPGKNSDSGNAPKIQKEGASPVADSPLPPAGQATRRPRRARTAILGRKINSKGGSPPLCGPPSHFNIRSPRVSGPAA